MRLHSFNSKNASARRSSIPLGELIAEPIEDILEEKPLPKRVLIVEDNFIIGLDMVSLLSKAGVEDTLLVHSAADAMQQLEDGEFDLVLLDIHLGPEMGFQIAEAMKDMHMRFVFATGYGDMLGVDARFGDVPVVTKPFVEEDLRDAMALALT